MDHTTHTPLLADELTPEFLLNAPIYGPDDEKIGTVSHVHGAGADLRVVLDVGGFLGFGAHTVALPVQNLNFMRDQLGGIHATTHMTKDQLKDLPEHHDH